MEVLTVAMRVEVVIIVSAVALDFLIDSLTGIDVNVLVDVFTGPMTAAPVFVMPSPLEEFRC